MRDRRLDGIRLIIIWVVLLTLFIAALCSCATQKKNHSELRGLMLLENTQLSRNKHYNSKKYQHTVKKTYRKYHRNFR